MTVGPTPPSVRHTALHISTSPTTSSAFSAARTVVEVPNVLSVRIRYGFDQRVGEAEFTTPIDPGLALDQALTLSFGPPGDPAPIPRFVGLVRGFRRSNNPPTVTTSLKGPLVRALEYENPEDPNFVGGLLIEDLTGSPISDAGTIVAAVLGRANVDTGPGSIAGSDVSYGHLAIEEFIWHRPQLSYALINAQSAGETALSYIERYDAIDAQLSETSGGRYRTFDSADGGIYRALIGGLPSGTPDFTFEEGVDILEGEFSDRIDDLRNYFSVQGYDPGNNNQFGPVHYELVADNPIQTGTHASIFSSPMIERASEADADASWGMSCQRVATALAFEQPFVTGWLTTFRDDVIGPGQTHHVQGHGGGPGALGVAGDFWAQSVEITLDEQGFTQRINYLQGLST